MQCGQAPNGELKLNILGVISSSVQPQCGQLNKVEYKTLSSFVLTSTSPSLALTAVSILSASLLFIPSSKTSLSTTTDMSCFLFLSKTMSSSSVHITPSTSTLTKPLFLKPSKSFSCAPFLPRTTGDIIQSLLPSSAFKTLSTIWSTVCFFISLLQCGQKGVPTLL